MTAQDATRPLRVTWFGMTDTGKVRANNEDALWAAPLGGEAENPPEEAGGASEAAWPGVLLAVADGMGGALAGEVASRLAVTTVGTELARRSREGDENGDGAAADLVRAVEAANACIRGEGDTNPQRRGMGTTLTAAWVHGARAEIAQVGDSRAYHFRAGHLRQITRDQSLVGKLVEDGIISEKEAETMAGRNIILQALGTDEPLQVAHDTQELEPDDRLLLCTDGLSGVVNNEDLQHELRQGGDPEALVRRLVALANERGGPDNVTVLLAAASRG